MALLDTRAARLYHIDAVTGHLVQQAASGPDPVAFGATVAGHAVAAQRPVITRDGPQRAYLAVPMIVNGRVIGALTNGRDTGAAFTVEEISLAQTLWHCVTRSLRPAVLAPPIIW